MLAKLICAITDPQQKKKKTKMFALWYSVTHAKYMCNKIMKRRGMWWFVNNIDLVCVGANIEEQM